MKTKKVELEIRTFEDVDPELLEAQTIIVLNNIQGDSPPKLVAVSCMEFLELAKRIDERNNKEMI